MRGFDAQQRNERTCGCAYENPSAQVLFLFGLVSLFVQGRVGGRLPEDGCGELIRVR
jgi:hypothetical protein